MPSVPFVVTCEADIKTEQICISWLKPEGGNEIYNYIVEWITEIFLQYSDTILYNGKESNNYTIKNLPAAQTVIVLLRANNSAGESGPSLHVFATGGYILYQHNVNIYQCVADIFVLLSWYWSNCPVK